MAVERSTPGPRSSRPPPAVETQTGGPRSPDEPEPDSVLQLGRYSGLKLIGRGGMGVVYAAQDEQLGRKVAIKVLARRAQQPDAHARLLREAQALARLAHPNVVAVHEVGDADGRVYLVMEHVDGMTFRTWLNAQRRTRTELLAVLAQAGRGLAAAHAVGLIHRDFKPDNIMVGDDGRVRVMDFGLARATDASIDDPEVSVSSSTRWLDMNVTRTGSLLGTPGYMAPEQYLHCPPTVASDIFSFCVVVFEALYGQRPFVGADPQAIRDAILGRAIQRPPRAEVPRWLDELVVRGLASSPTERWPDMPALLDALGDDPHQRRRALLRAALAALLLAAVALPLALHALESRRAAVQAAADDKAAARLAVVERSLATGDSGASDAMFRTFVDDPAHQGTRALALAWQHRGDLRRADDDLDAALTAYAQAYVHARLPEDTVLALRSLAEVFHRKNDGRALAQALAVLQARGVVDAELLGLGFDAAIIQRDLRGAAAAAERLGPDDPRGRWRGLLTPLAAGIGSSLRVGDITTLPGDPPTFAALDGGAVTFLDRDLRPHARRPFEGPTRIRPGLPWALEQRDDHLIAHDLRAPPGAPPLWSGPSPGPIYRFFALDTGGRADILFSRIAPYRGFRVLRDLGGAAPRERVAHLATDASDSDLEAAVQEDLDGDGTLELVTAIGPWHAFDLRVFHTDPTGDLELVHRRRIGPVGALGILRRDRETQLVVVKDDHLVDPDTFPGPNHSGEPAGVYLFRWTGSDLLETGFTPLPEPIVASRAQVLARLVAADLDGDGRDELLFSTHERRASTIIIRPLGDQLDLLPLDGVRILDAAQLDDDPADELLVTLAPSAHLWILGRGDTPVPSLTPAQDPPRSAPAGLTDPLLRQQWSRAEDLAASGLSADAAASLERAASYTDDHALRRALWNRAAELHTRHGDLAAALALDRRLADDPELGAVALARSAAALTLLGRYEEARAAALSLAAHPDRSAEQTAAASELRADLEPLLDARRSFQVRFDAPLAGPWQIHRPAGVRRDPNRGVLAIAAAAGPEPLAELPFAWEGGPFFLEYELDLERLEYGACVLVEILDDAGKKHLSTGYCAQGGGGALYHRGTCTLAGELAAGDFALLPVASGRTAHQLRFGAAYFPRRSTFECTLEEDGRSVRHLLPPTTPPTPGRYRLRLSVVAQDRPPALAVFALRRLSVRGAQPMPTAGARDRLGQLLVEGEPLAMLSALTIGEKGVDRPALLRLLAYDDLGDSAGLAAAARDVVPHLDDPTWRSDLVTVLRTRPAAAIALRAAADSALLPLLADAWSVLPAHRNDPELRREAFDELRLLDALHPATDRERHALRALLLTRADLRRRAGMQDRARQDLEAALALPPAEDPDDDALRHGGHTQLVGMLVRADPSAAFEHAAAAIRLSRDPDQTRQYLRELPGVTALVAQTPAWRALLSGS